LSYINNTKQCCLKNRISGTDSWNRYVCHFNTQKPFFSIVPTQTERALIILDEFSNLCPWKSVQCPFHGISFSFPDVHLSLALKQLLEGHGLELMMWKQQW
jgi:hypothetical protein